MGVLNTVIAYLAYALMIFFGFNYAFALITDYLVGAFTGLLLHKKYTFRVKERIGRKTIKKSIISNVLIFCINLTLLHVTIDMLNFDPYFSQMAALLIITISSFIFYNFFIFKRVQSDRK